MEQCSSSAVEQCSSAAVAVWPFDKDIYEKVNMYLNNIISLSFLCFTQIICTNISTFQENSDM